MQPLQIDDRIGLFIDLSGHSGDFAIAHEHVATFQCALGHGVHHRAAQQERFGVR